MYEFRKIKNDHSRIREDSILCERCSPIEKGKQVVLLAEPLTPGATLRMINTSKVVNIEIRDTQTTRIYTESGSIYDIVFLGKEKS